MFYILPRLPTVHSPTPKPPSYFLQNINFNPINYITVTLSCRLAVNRYYTSVALPTCTRKITLTAPNRNVSTNWNLQTAVRLNVNLSHSMFSPKDLSNLASRSKKLKTASNVRYLIARHQMVYKPFIIEVNLKWMFLKWLKLTHRTLHPMLCYAVYFVIFGCV